MGLSAGTTKFTETDRRVMRDLTTGAWWLSRIGDMFTMVPRESRTPPHDGRYGASLSGRKFMRREWLREVPTTGRGVSKSVRTYVLSPLGEQIADWLQTRS